MKLNNKGFAISTIMYMILIMAVILITLTLTLLSSRKLILDSSKQEAKNNIYNVYYITYRQALEILKNEAIVYAQENSIEYETIKISDLNSSIDTEILNGYKLSEKYLTMYLNDNEYDVYLGKSEIITDISEPINNLLDIIDYKIYGNSVQEGDPTPEIPIEVKSVGDIITDETNENYGKYKIPITVAGKNFIDLKDMLIGTNINASINLYEQILESETGIYDYNGISFEITSDDKIKMSGTVGTPSSLYIVFNINKTFKAGDYYLKNGMQRLKNLAGAYRTDANVYYSDGTKTRLTSTSDSQYLQLSFEEDTTITKISVFMGTGAIIPEEMNLNFYIQMETGTEATEYEPYIEPLTTNIYLDGPLKKIGNYEDNIILKNNEITRYVSEYIINEETDISKFDNVTDYSAFSFSKSDIIDIEVKSPSMKYKSCGSCDTNDKWSDVYQISGSISDTYKRIDFTLPNTILDLTEAKEWLEENPIPLYYVKESFSDESIELPEISTKNKFTKILVETEVQPSHVELTVIKKIKQI